MIDDLFDDDNEVDISLEAPFIPYNIYWRKFGVRRLGHLSAPILGSMERIGLPRNAVLHHLPLDDADMGIKQTDILVRDATRLIYIDNVIELATREGLIKRAPIRAPALTRQFFRENRKMRPLMDLERVNRDQKVLIVANYALLNHLWLYRHHLLSFYNKSKNIFNTLWTKVNEIAEKTDRDHFIVVNLPTVIPSVSEFRKAELNSSVLNLKAFHEPEALFLLDVWKWLGMNREKSSMSILKPEHYNKIHFIVPSVGVWSLVNIGFIDEWRRTNPEEVEEEGEESHGGLSGTAMQKRFLRYLTILFEFKNQGVKTADPVVSEVIKNETVVAEKSDSVNENHIPDKDDIVLSDVNNKELDKALVEEKVKNEEKEKTITTPFTSDKGETTPPKPVDKRVDLSGITKKPEKKDNTLHLKDVKIDRNKKIQLVSVKEDPEIENAFNEELDSIDHLFVEDKEAMPVGKNDHLEPLKRNIMNKADKLADQGLLSSAQYNRIEKLSTKFKELPNPHGEGTLEDLATIKNEDTALPKIDPIKDNDAIIDKSMLKTIIEDMDNKYNKDLLEKDVAAVVLGIQKAGIIVTKYDVEEHEDVMNHYKIYTVKLTPIDGNPSTVKFKLPVIDDDGSYLNNSIKNKLRKQRVDVSIRKVKPDKVALTSYYSKFFISRSDKVVDNYERWLFNNIILKSREENSSIKSVVFNNVWSNEFKNVPKIYSVIAKRFSAISTAEFTLHFNYALRNQLINDIALMSKVEEGGRVVVGKVKDGVIVITKENEFIVVKDNGEISLGHIDDVLQLEGSSPIEIAEMGVLNKKIPLGVVLGYYIGFANILKVSKVKYRKEDPNTRFKISDNEFAIKFNDEAFIFSKKDLTACLLFGGFNKFKDFIKNYSVSVFNRKDIYSNLLDTKGIGVRYLRELDLMEDMWIDPIAEDLLRSMGEPTDFVPLLFKANELLLTDWSPHESDMRFQRIRGYERFAGFVYQELVKAVRTYNVQSAAIDASISIHPEAVWREIDKDVSKYLVQESNPIHNLKEKETVTFAGKGGRSAETMTKPSRVFHKNDVGVISEASPDNKSVGAIVYLTPNPRFNSLRGTIEDLDGKEIENSSLLSTAALISPGSDMDSPARINFINIQHSAGIFAKGNRASPLRTGYEKIIANRTSDLYAYTAKKKGKIISLEEDHITVEYDDGEIKVIELGRRFGLAEGSVIPHQLTTKLKLGDKVDKNDVIAYNENYFEPDFFNPRLVNWKLGSTAKTVILESTDTLEDSSAISERLSDIMATTITKVRNIVVGFDQTIKNMVKVGQHVDLTSILCTIEDPITASNNLFDEETLSTLHSFSKNTPRAKYSGVIEKIEVFYNGETSDMSDSLKAIANASDRNLKRYSQIKRKNKTITGSVDSSMRIDGNPLELDTLVIKIYITTDVPANVGDKMVFGNQMKTVCGRVMSQEITTESGEIIDAVFGYQSISNRIVNSPFVIGTTNTLLKVISKKAVEIYKGK